MGDTLRIAGIVKESVVDGPGFRYVIFVQGCPRRCPGCHNPQTQCMEGGTFVEVESILKDIQENPLLTGVTFSGGEPFLHARVLAPLAKKCHELGLSVMTYTGYTFEELESGHNPDWDKLIEESDIIVDGPYKQELRSLQVKFRGSTNQRLIDVKKTLKMHLVQVL